MPPIFFENFMATSENPDLWQDTTPYEENKGHLSQFSNVAKGFRRLPYVI